MKFYTTLILLFFFICEIKSQEGVPLYFDYSQFTCGVVPGAYFAYQKGFVQFIGQAITAPSWNSTTDVEDGSSDQRDFYTFSELVP